MGLAVSLTVKVIPMKTTIYTSENLSTVIDTKLPVEIWYNTTGYDEAFLQINVINMNENQTIYQQTIQVTPNSVNTTTYDIPVYMFPNFPKLDDGLYTVSFELIGINTTTGSYDSTTAGFNFTVNEPISIAIYDVDTKKPYPQVDKLKSGEEYTFYWPFRLDGVENDMIYATVKLVNDIDVPIAKSTESKVLYNKDWQTLNFTLKVPNVNNIVKGKIIFEARDNHGQLFYYEWSVTIVPEKVNFENIQILPSTELEIGKAAYIIVSIKNYSPDDKTVTISVKLPWRDTIDKTIYIPGESTKKVLLPIKTPTYATPGYGTITFLLKDESGNVLDAKTLKVELVKHYKVITNMVYNYNPKSKILYVTLYSDLDSPSFITVIANGQGVIVEPTTQQVLISKNTPANLQFNVTPLKSEGNITLTVDYNGNVIYKKTISLTFEEKKEENKALTSKNTTIAQKQPQMMERNITNQTTSQIIEKRGADWWFYAAIAVLAIIAVVLGYKIGRKGEEEVE